MTARRAARQETRRLQTAAAFLVCFAMGTYLSTPVTEKCQESREDLDCKPFPITWAVVDMQGWRKSMEDAHITRTDVPLLDDCDNPGADQSSKAETAKVFGVFDGHGGPEVARFCQLYLVSVLTQQEAWKEAVQNMRNQTNATEDSQVQEVTLAPKETNMGRALVQTFHALDRMIDDPSRREELLRLRTSKPGAGAHLDLPAQAASGDESLASEQSSEPNAISVANNEASSVTSEFSEDNAILEESEKGDDDSDKSTGHEEAANEDQDLMLDDVASDADGNDQVVIVPAAAPSPVVPRLVGPAAPETMSEMIQRLLNLNANPESGQIVVQLDGDNKVTDPQSYSEADAAEPSDFSASIIRNGRPICNLPDHPIHAGATAVVTVILGNQLTVANAGDSRAILCRSGAAYALTSDHKPLQDREMTRIRNAGGFVNHFGRVNGNLNLSRSIGDLKYKQVPGLPPAEQMITAEPDIVQVTLCPDDDFLVLGCDGIFDCLTNEQCVEYVRSRINEKTPSEIGVEMLNDIISDDPRASQGIGGDNMTIMIVDLQPLSRPYRQSNL